jgi:hypothetical protein
MQGQQAMFELLIARVVWMEGQNAMHPWSNELGGASQRANAIPGTANAPILRACTP